MKTKTILTFLLMFLASCLVSISCNKNKDDSSTASSIPTGALKGVYSVSANKKVYFSKGNLQYQASSNKWRFANNQYDHIGDANSNISSSYSGWIDMFGWGTGNNPIKTSEYYYDYYYFSDWGNNTISNGIDGIWRTLTTEEWMYLFNERHTVSCSFYVRVNLNGVNGIVILPDNWNRTTYEFAHINEGSASFNSNIISIVDWENKIEPQGVVFLPVNGYRSGVSVYHDYEDDGYWSASSYDYGSSNGIFFNNDRSCFNCWCWKYRGESVRLVCDLVE